MSHLFVTKHKIWCTIVGSGGLLLLSIIFVVRLTIIPVLSSQKWRVYHCKAEWLAIHNIWLTPNGKKWTRYLISRITLVFYWNTAKWLYSSATWFLSGEWSMFITLSELLSVGGHIIDCIYFNSCRIRGFEFQWMFPSCGVVLSL